MQKQILSFEQTKQFSKLVIDYINGNPELAPFYNQPHQLESYKTLIASKQAGFTPAKRNTLVTALRNQYVAITTNKQIVDQQIALLAKENTFTITTGHQLCLATGPLYFIYKILTAINLSEQLKKAYPEYNFIPVYWMATEDHDFEEINHFHAFGKKYTWQTEFGNAVGQISTKGIVEIIAEFKAAGGNLPFINEIVALLEKAYGANNTLAEATRYLVNELFGKYGLLIIDGNDATLKQEVKSVFEKELLHQVANTAVTQTSNALQQIGVDKPQVTPREINLFYLATNKRERIVKEDNIWKVLHTNISWTDKELLEELTNHPEHFSPNVILRPVYQEMILPNLAYIGGGGELAYWLQLKELFTALSISFPILVLRHSVMLTDNVSVNRLQKNKLSIEDVFLTEQELINKYIALNDSTSFTTDEESKALQELYTALKNKIIQIDSTLGASVEGELKKTLDGLKNIEGKATRAIKQRNEVGINQLKKIKANYFPEGELQERHENIMPYLAQHGLSFIDTLKNNLGEFEPAFNVLQVD